MTKTDICLELALKHQLTFKQVKFIVDEFFDMLKQGLLDGKSFTLKDFGVLSVKTRGARLSCNPRTGEPIQLPASKYIHFKQSRRTREKLNRGETHE